ncbi:MAG: aromatic ring-hydroxylating dioxygenase subunit alpha [Caulobacteraceae bacterium]|nr:aromatic ring-hydroxylating dioxygenase subunit alpha [Caulobacteraceae bacterium]
MGKIERADALIGQVPFAITDPERIPAKRYYDEEFYKLECERLWPRVWQMACRLEEIPNVGDFVEYKILDKSVLVVRTEGGIKAFHNVCRHRGMRLAHGHGNCEAAGLVCPFHGWRWNMNGENTYVLEPGLFSKEVLAKAEIDLKPCRVETWGGCAFINFDHDAAPLRQCIEPFATMHDRRHVEKMRVEWWLAASLPCNWKLAMEAFHEGYHVMRTHPQLLPAQVRGAKARYFQMPGSGSTGYSQSLTYKTRQQVVEGSIKYMKRLNEGMAGMIHARDVAVAEDLRDMELPEDVEAAKLAWNLRLCEEITRRSRAAGLDAPDFTQVDAEMMTSGVNFCFPNYFLLPIYGNASSYRIRPTGPETCLFELWSLTLMPEDEKRDPPRAPTPMRHDDPSWPPIPKQDYSNLPDQQLGLHAGEFDYMILSRDVEGLISNYQRLIDGFLAGVEQKKLVAAMSKVNGGIDEPIKDLGF